MKHPIQPISSRELFTLSSRPIHRESIRSSKIAKKQAYVYNRLSRLTVNVIRNTCRPDPSDSAVQITILRSARCSLQQYRLYSERFSNDDVSVVGHDDAEGAIAIPRFDV